MSVPPENQPPITDPHHLLPAHATEDTSTRSGYRKWIVLGVLALIIGVVVWRILETKKADKAEAQKAAAMANRPVPVQYVPVEQKTVPVFLSALGTVTAYNTVSLQARVSGQLLAVNFTEGQSVRKGQLLLQIDPRPYQAALDQAIGTLAKDEANLQNTNAEAQRYTALYEAGVISKESQQLQVSNAGQAKGTIKADQAAIEAAKVNLGYTKIYSPIDGVVGLRQVDPGNIVNSGSSTALVVITQVHPIAVVFTLPEDQLPLVQQAMKGGSKLVVEAYDRSDAHKIAAGTLLTIDNQIDTTTGTAKLKAVFENTDNALFANQFVNVRLILRQRPNATVIPTAAIESGTQGDYVFVVNDGPTPKDKLKNQPNANAGKGKTAAPADSGQGNSKSNETKFHADTVPVHVAFVIGTSSIISDGMLQPGQKVVVDGQEKLVDGGNVKPQPAKNTSPQPAQGGVGAGATQNGPVTTSTNSADGLQKTGNPVVPGPGQQAHNDSGPGSTVSSANTSGSSSGNGGGNQ